MRAYLKLFKNKFIIRELYKVKDNKVFRIIRKYDVETSRDRNNYDVP